MRGIPWKEAGWEFRDGKIHAPCGCVATPRSFIPDPPMTFPGDGTLQFSTFEDCGKSGDFCVFQKKNRVHAFRQDIPSDLELNAWLVGLGWKQVVQ